MKAKNFYFLSSLFVICLFLSLFPTHWKENPNQEFYEETDIIPYNSDTDDLLPEWNYTWGGSEHERGRDICIDSSDNIYITGETESFGAGDDDIFLLKYNKQGIKQWNVTWGSERFDNGRGIAVDSQDNIFITGVYMTEQENLDVVILKFDNSGNLLWNRTWGNTQIDWEWGLDIQVDSNNNLYVCGYTYKEGVNDWDICILKYNNNGDLLWNQTWGTVYKDIGHCIMIDSYDQVYIVGESNNRMALIKYDQIGLQQWNYTGDYSTRGYAGLIDLNNDIYIAEESYLDDRIILAKFNASGDLYWEKKLSSEYGHFVLDMALDSSNNFYTSGRYGDDILLVKFNNSGSHLWKTT